MQKFYTFFLLALFSFLLLPIEPAHAEWMLRVRMTMNNYSSSTPDSAPLKIENSTPPEVALDAYIAKDLSLELSGSGMRESTNHGRVWVTPLTLTALYHFLPNQPLQFYAGAGMNYTAFFLPSDSSIKYKNEYGPVFQVGADLKITNNFLLNVDAKKMFIRPEVSIGGGPYVQNKLDPWIFGAGIGFKL